MSECIDDTVGVYDREGAGVPGAVLTDVGHAVGRLYEAAVGGTAAEDTAPAGKVKDVAVGTGVVAHAAVTAPVSPKDAVQTFEAGAGRHVADEGLQDAVVAIDVIGDRIVWGTADCAGYDTAGV